MDKKRIIKTVSAVCFVIVCGLLYVVVCKPFGTSPELVFDKQTDALQSATENVPISSVLQEKAEGEAGKELVKGDTEDETVGAMLYVHVCGAVLKEGVYALSAGSRVTDAITAAGGFREDADVSFHNLAAMLTDGRKIYVPTMEETKEFSLSERTEGTENGLLGAYGGTVEKKVNLNTAGLAELMTLSGIGEAKAESILKYREKVGRFQTVEELKKVSGIGDAMFERIRDEIVAE